MKTILLTSLLFFINFAYADNFLTDAQSISSDLKKNLVKNLSAKIKKDGVAQAVPFCHSNVKSIAKSAVGDRLKNYQVGRTSHKIRNLQNTPAPWMEQYLNEFKGKTNKEIDKKYIVHRLKDNKRVYLEPLYVQGKCLLCHGQAIAKPVETKISSLYPKDNATGFKLNEFRGFIWVKEK